MPCDSVATIKTILAKIGLDAFLKSAEGFTPLKNYLEKEGFSNVSLTHYGPHYQVISLNTSTLSFLSHKEEVRCESPDLKEQEKIEQSISKLQDFLAQQKAIKAITKKFEVISTQKTTKATILSIMI